jgi:hypothetical protein
MHCAARNRRVTEIVIGTAVAIVETMRNCGDEGSAGRIKIAFATLVGSAGRNGFCRDDFVRPRSPRTRPSLRAVIDAEDTRAD